MKSFKITKNFTIEEENNDSSLSLKEYAKIKILRAGVCESDVALFAGKLTNKLLGKCDNSIWGQKALIWEKSTYIAQKTF